MTSKQQQSRSKDPKSSSKNGGARKKKQGNVDMDTDTGADTNRKMLETETIEANGSKEAEAAEEEIKENKCKQCFLRVKTFLT